MVKQEQVSGHWFNQRLVLFVLIIAAALFIHGTAATASSSLPIHGSVAMWIEEHPGEPVPLIVQHDGTPDDLLAFVRESGGVVEREFHIVPAIDIEIPANVVNGLGGQGDVEWISLDAPIVSTHLADDGETLPTGKKVENIFPKTVNADEVWNDFAGEGITVAVIDTGISDADNPDFAHGTTERVTANVVINADAVSDEDGFGHGTHVSGIIAGDGSRLDNKYPGIAPMANLVDVKISDDAGNATVGDLMAGLEWVDDNRIDYNIRVLNLSVSSASAQSYKVDPIDAAVELLWFHGIVVVVAAGNEGDADDAVHYPPANDPFVITVGAIDDQGTEDDSDDRVASWSSRGTTQDGFAKPDILTPGANLISTIDPTSVLATEHPDYVVDGNYFQMSGTSMSAGVASGLAALVLDAHPDWTPGEVKYVLMETAKSLSGEGDAAKADKAIAFNGELESTDDGLTPSYLLLAAIVLSDETIDDALIEEALEDPTILDGIRWRDAEFEGIRWRGLEFNGIRWRDVDWSGIRWRGVEFNGSRGRGLDFEGTRWQGIRWRSFVGN